MQTNVSQLIQTIKTKLVEEMHANIQNGWISDCVKYFIERDSNCDINYLYENTKDQFLLATISDTSNQVIGDSFNKRKDLEWKFDGKILLQMQYILNISEPFYDQWKRLHNKSIEDPLHEKRESKTFHVKKKRMFKLELTDGYKTIHAMEMKYIKCLNTKLKPGIKIIICGPVKVVNSIFFLEPQNIKIVGGELDELFIINAYENVLLRLLNKPTVNNPVQNYDEPVFEEETTIPSRNQYQSVQIPSRPVQQAIMSAPQQKNDPLDNDDDLDDIDFDLLDQIEAEVNKKHQEEQKKTTNFMTQEEEEEEIRAINQMNFSAFQSPQVTSVHRANDLLIPQMPDQSEQSEEIENETSSAIPITKAITPPIPKRKPTLTDDNYPYKIEDLYNFVTIEQYDSLSIRDKMKRTYAVQVKVDQVIDKLKIEKEEWILRAKVIDIWSKTTLLVRFTDDLVAQLAKRTAREMRTMMERVKIQPQIKDDMLSAIALVNKAINDKTILITITMNLKLPADYENIVENYLELSNVTKQIVNRKISDEGISLG
ncbi:hypothetical protein PVAND_000323 [Polypedilum vanderplanki]|uniref:RecQ-mediated genome instability protein 1 n=1 Tax=Polypedilum vanderplanki TaxID=319348 RepID=A0A9J6BJR2_POLVA|nr:hypothetical protein PVAND_000323 [Polypedilum vanderplanki]